LQIRVSTCLLCKAYLLPNSDLKLDIKSIMSASESTSKKVAIIIGSTRVKRIGPDVAKFVLDVISAAQPSIEFTTIDIATFNLPVFDEPDVPATVPTFGGKHIHAHTIAWSSAIAPFDGYVVVSAEYNQGPPGGLKNATDYLYNEWTGKPILLITYGSYGGRSCSESLTKTFETMRMDVVATKPQLTFPGTHPILYMRASVQAAGSGILSEETTKAWSEDGKEDILKGLAELKEKLDAPKSD